MLVSAGESAIVRKPIPELYRVRYSDGTEEGDGADSTTFTLVLRDRRQLEWRLKADAYSAARGGVPPRTSVSTMTAQTSSTRNP